MPSERRIQQDGFAGRKPIPTAAAARERINADAERARHEALHYATGAALTAIQAGIEKAHHRATVFLNDWPRGTTDSMKKQIVGMLMMAVVRVNNPIRDREDAEELRQAIKRVQQ